MSALDHAALLFLVVGADVGRKLPFLVSNRALREAGALVWNEVLWCSSGPARYQEECGCVNSHLIITVS